jgi:hypothetical protein
LKKKEIRKEGKRKKGITKRKTKRNNKEKKQNKNSMGMLIVMLLLWKKTIMSLLTLVSCLSRYSRRLAF